jgi:hypothetical protein
VCRTGARSMRGTITARNDLDKVFVQFSLTIELESSLESVFADLAIKYANRALNHSEKGESDNALADYEQSNRARFFTPQLN